MARLFVHQALRYELRDPWSVQPSDRVLCFTDLVSARWFLSRFRESLDFRRLREVVEDRVHGSTLFRLSDDDVIGQLAWVLWQGRLRVVELPAETWAYRPRERIVFPERAPSVPVTVVREEPVPAPAPPVPQAYLQPGVLERAAQEGRPFCEVCERALLESMFSSLHEVPDLPPAPRVEPRPEAVALREAATSGAPFCEACERALLEQMPLAMAETIEEPSPPPPEPQPDAVALREAAGSGAPFCEACERALLERMPLALAETIEEPSPPAPEPQPAQAEALRSAAEHGAPLCES
jgi:hypothetical protein